MERRDGLDLGTRKISSEAAELRDFPSGIAFAEELGELLSRAKCEGRNPGDAPVVIDKSLMIKR